MTQVYALEEGPCIGFHFLGPRHGAPQQPPTLLAFKKSRKKFLSCKKHNFGAPMRSVLKPTQTHSLQFGTPIDLWKDIAEQEAKAASPSISATEPRQCKE